MTTAGAERIEVWQADLEVLLERIGVWFARRDLRGRMRGYVVGLLVRWDARMAGSWPSLQVTTPRTGSSAC